MLNQVLWSYQNSPKDATSTTPYELVYGYDAILPIEIIFQNVRITRQNDLPVKDYWNTLCDELNELEEERLGALENLIRKKESIAISYNHRVKQKNLW